VTLRPHAPRSKSCPVCLKAFIPARPLQSVCGPICARRSVAAKKAKERKETRAKRESLKTRRQWIAEAQVAVNKYCRLRDIHAGRGCISCGAPYRLAGGGAFDAGHFRSVGSAPHLRYFTTQIRLQCVRCNRHLAGNAVEFRRGLVALLGVEKVEAIEVMQGTAKWSIEYLRRLKAVMSKKARRLEKRMEQ
jgi:hypothetical protein